MWKADIKISNALHYEPVIRPEMLKVKRFQYVKTFIVIGVRLHPMS